MKRRQHSAPLFARWLRWRATADERAASLLAIVGDLSSFRGHASKQRIEAALVGCGARARDLEVFDVAWRRYIAFAHRHAILVSLARDDDYRVWEVLLTAARSFATASQRKHAAAIVRRCMAKNPEDVLPAATYLVELLGRVEHAHASVPPLIALPA